MTKEDDENFESSTKWWVCDDAFVEGDNKVRDNFLVTEMCRCSTQILHCQSEPKLTVFPIPKNFDAHLIMLELGKFEI